MDTEESPWNSLISKAERFLKSPQEIPEKIPQMQKPSLFADKTPEELRNLVQRQHRVLEKLFATPIQLGVVALVLKPEGQKSSVVVITNGRTVELELPDALNITPGDTVRINFQTQQILDIAPLRTTGSIAVFKSVINDQLCEVEIGGSTRTVYVGIAGTDCPPNERVVLDASNSVILMRLGTNEKRFRLGSKPTITWDDIGGLERAKQELKEAIEAPFQDAELFQFYRKNAIGGVVLFGPPGCGKTMLIEASATALAKIHGADAVGSGFINVKGPEILEMYVGNAERNVRTLFAMARQHKERYGYPAIIAIDEADALLSRRGTGMSSDMEKTIVPAFLTEMQGVDDSSAIVILSTNRPDVLDPAVIREGRINRHIKVTRPTQQSATAILLKSFQKVPLIGGTPEEFATATAAAVYSEEYALSEVITQSDAHRKFCLAQLVNGAMLVEIVNKGTSRGFQRDRANKTKTGITLDDLKIAVQETFESKRDLDYRDELREFVDDIKDAKSVVRLRQAQLP